MRILGIDPGLVATGYGIIEVGEQFQLVCRAAGVIRSESSKAAARSPQRDSSELAARLLHIHTQVTALLHEFIPDALAMEALYSTYTHPKTAILMGHARGAIFLAAAQRAVPVFNYAPTEIKRSLTGNGRAGKAQVQAMVQRLLRLPQLPTPDHVSDALAMAVCHAYRERNPVKRVESGEWRV